MSKNFARYLTCLIANDYDKKSRGCISSYECEIIEKRFQEGKFDEIENFLRRRLWAN